MLGVLCGLAGCRSSGISHHREMRLLAGPRSHEVIPPVGADDCVDAYFWDCANEWQQLAVGADAATCSAYNNSVWQLLSAACRHGRIDPTRGLTIKSGGNTFIVPVEFCGFTWKPSDFQRLHLPPQGSDPLLERRYSCPGVGFSLVVERARRTCDSLEARFFPEKSFYAATVVLEFGQLPAGGDSAALPAAAVLKFYDPLHVRSTSNGSQSIAKDFSAPLALTLEEAPRSYFAGFIEPGGSATRPRLNVLEPYQPGKIPLLLIHGLFSDPLSWADLINDLRATPGFADRYQIWVFRYPTGRGFMQSATALRTELRSLVEALDPTGSDPALRQIVLMGHSMGGLIAKLQVTYSDELIWNELANRPLETIVTTEQTRSFLAENSYFDPSPHVSRVIFIASPHSGSLTSSSLVGRGASLLVEPAPEQTVMHEQLMRDNPNTFNPLVEQRLPTSIDMLSPQSPLLDVMKRMRLKPGLCLHNIIGVSVPLTLDGPSDGVVSVRSASHPYCQSVMSVSTMHSHVHRDLRTSYEVLRILQVCPTR